MKLFTDRNALTTADLGEHDSYALTIATAEGVSVDQKLRASMDEVGARLEHYLRWAQSGQELTLDNVMLTKSVVRWVCLHCLERIYSDVGLQQGNQRHSERSAAIQTRAKQAEREMLDEGIGVVVRPIPQPRKAAVTAVTGNAAAGLYYVRCTFVRDGREGSASEVASVMVSTNETVQVSLDEAGWDWNVYLSRDGSQFYRQNHSLILGGITWQMGHQTLLKDAELADTSMPDYFVRRRQVLMRG